MNSRRKASRMSLSLNDEGDLREDADHNQGDSGKGHGKAQQVSIHGILAAAALAFAFSLEGHEEHEGDAQVEHCGHQRKAKGNRGDYAESTRKGIGKEAAYRQGLPSRPS